MSPALIPKSGKGQTRAAVLQNGQNDPIDRCAKDGTAQNAGNYGHETNINKRPLKWYKLYSDI